ncbi:unnamed protein product, partial [Ixodes persulcatus]
QEQETALHFAAQYGHADAVALLLSHGAEPGLRNVRGESPLDLAAQYGRLESVSLLAGAQAHSLQRLATPHHSPLHLAARNGHRQVVRLLLDSPPPAFASPVARQGLPRRNSAGLGSPDLLADMAAARHAKRPSLGDVARVSLRAHEERPGGPLVLSLSPGELAQVPPPACFQVRSDEDGHWAGSGYLPMASLQQPKPQRSLRPTRRKHQ